MKWPFARWIQNRWKAHGAFRRPSALRINSESVPFNRL